MTIKQRSVYQQLAIVVLWSVVHIGLYLFYGPRLTLFDSEVYLQASEFLIRYGHNQHTHQLFYTSYIAIIAAFRLMTPGETIVIIIFQCLLSLLGAVSIGKVAERIFKDVRARIVCAILFLLWWDCISWNVTLMSESIFTSVVCFLIYALSCYEGKWQQMVYVVILLTLLITIRPTGVLFWPATFVFFLYYHHEHLKYRPRMKWSMILGSLLLTASVAYHMLTIWDFTEELAKGNIVTYADLIPDQSLKEKISIRVSDQELLLSSGHPVKKIALYIARNPIEFVTSALLKVWYLMSGLRPYYTFYHNVFNACWMIFIYASFFHGLRKYWRTPLAIFALSVILFNVLLISIASVDWDNRFFMPMEPGIILFSSGGVIYFLQKLKKISKRFHAQTFV